MTPLSPAIIFAAVILAATPGMAQTTFDDPGTGCVRHPDGTIQCFLENSRRLGVLSNDGTTSNFISTPTCPDGYSLQTYQSAREI